MIGNDLEQGFATPHHAADRMDLRAEDDAARWRAQQRALELPLARGKLLAQVEHLRLRLPELRQHLGRLLLLDLLEVQLGLADLLVRTGNLGREPSDGPLELEYLALD